MKKMWNLHPCPRGGFKLLRAMKVTLLLVICCVLNSTAMVNAQQKKFSLQLKNATIKEVLTKIKTQEDISFIFNEEQIEQAGKVNIKINNGSLETILDACLKETNLDYEIHDDVVVIKPSLMKVNQEQKKRTIRGEVIDNEGDPMPGVNVIFKRSSDGKFESGTVTNVDGRYQISIPDVEGALHFTFIGTQGYIEDVNGKQVINATLLPSLSEVDEVIVTGLYERERASFTGAVASVTADELKEVGNKNVVESLKSLDPSFIMIENDLQGANPNAMPTIEVRGKTSISTDAIRDEFSGDPNQPLFILDGFETSLRTIIDLDMNRVESITILKDAASTAIYGAKAANGVVVVETKKPVAGKLKLSYTGDYRVEIPDLSDYNMMNAEEKLQFELLAGRYEEPAWSSFIMLEDSVYNARLAAVRRGVDTYWLSEPLQLGITNGHTVYADGGDQSFRYGASVNYKHSSGVMIGSGRDTWSGNIDLNYRKGKINVYNKLTVSGTSADESPYGSFSLYANANPYFKKYNEDGEVERYLDRYKRGGGYRTVDNPLYNAQLQFKDNTEGLTVNNNLRLQYNVNKSLRVQGNLQLRKSITTTTIFKSPQHTSYDGTGVFEKGQYTNNRVDKQSYRGNIMVTYAKVFNKKHRLTTNLRAEIEEQDNNSLKMVAVGFPIGSGINPTFANSYKPDSKPSSSVRLFRRNNLLGSANYSYDQRYLLDATYRLDGSTAFGSMKKYSSFWSLGLGWNINKENFMKNVSWLEILKLRGSVGVTGNQSFGNVSSISVYEFNSENSPFGQGVDLATLGNPNLEWQNTYSEGLGLDISAFKKLRVALDVYYKKTDPLVVVIDMPSSTGIYGYPDNAGYMKTKGFEAKINYTAIRKTKERISWIIGLSGSMVKSEYGGFNNRLESLNTDQQKNNSLIRYKDGYSPDDIWAVRSLGIDPATGREVFLRPNGQTTFDYFANEEVVVGNTRPDLEGTFRNSFNYKSFSVGFNFRFRTGGDVFNRALYDKVENISFGDLSLNQDARALYDRWQKPGDIAQFKGISLTDNTPMSSRFVQRENVLIGESINMGFHFRNNQFVKNLGMRELRLMVYMNDIFRISSVKRERGINYPFANTVSFSLNANF